MGFIEDIAKGAGNVVDDIGTAFNLPEVGLSELLSGGQKTNNTGRIDLKDLGGNNPITAAGQAAFSNATRPQEQTTPIVESSSQGNSVPVGQDTGSSLGDFSDYSNSSVGSGYNSADVAALQEKGNLLSNLLGRIDRSKAQGLGRISDLYGQERANADIDRRQAVEGFDSQRNAQKSAREQAFERALSGSNANYRSLSDIIGRSAGSGSSAYRELLPKMLGGQLSADRREILNTSGENLRNIQTSQNQYDVDFAQSLQDLLRQKKQNEENLLTGIEGQRQDYLTQQIANQAELADARGLGYQGVRNAISPFQEQYNQSLNQVDSFFDKFAPSFAPREVAQKAPELSEYTTDRANVNAQSQGTADPYTALLRKKQQERN